MGGGGSPNPGGGASGMRGSPLGSGSPFGHGGGSHFPGPRRAWLDAGVIEESERPSRVPGLPRLVVAAVVAGALTGLLGAAFRLTLREAEVARTALVAWAGRYPATGWIVVVGAAAVAVAVARSLVRLAPYAGGSGVQHVEAVARGESQPAPPRTL